MKIIQWNIRGYRSQYPSLLHLIQSHNPSVVCLQETMLGNFSPTGPAGYSLQSFSPSRTSIPGDGLAFLFRNNVPYCPIPLNTTLQAFAFRTGTSPQITICNIYISPNENFSTAQLNNLIRQLPQPFIIMGDMNCKSPTWGGEHLDTRGERVEDFIRVNDLCVMNTGSPTRMDIHSGNSSAIDLTLCSPSLLPLYDWYTEEDLFGSDHFPVIICNSQDSPVRNPSFIEKRADWSKFQSLTRVDQRDRSIEELDIDEAVSLFNSYIINAAREAIPMSSGRILPRCVPWWTAECEAVTAERKRALWRYQHTRLPADKISMKRARARAHYVLRKTKQESWNNYVSTLTVHTPMSKIWSRVKKMSGKHPPINPPCLLVNGNYVSESLEVANALASHYASVSNGSTYSDSFRARRANIEAREINFHSTEEEEYNSPITLNELKTSLRQCSKSAPGEDLITYEMLRHIHPSLLEMLLSLYNKVWNSGEFPSAWRKATVLAFHKPGKPKTEPASYRPIALTSCVGKLLEKIINFRLMYHLEQKELLSPVQFGFRQHKSTIDPIALLTSHIQTSFQKREQVVCVFFDLEKAYDTTWKYGILQTLYSSGIRGKMGFFIKAFLQERIFRVKIGNCLSNWHQQVEGVPQGSVLSCALFALAINGLPSALPNHVHSSLYVDDFALYSSSANGRSLERRLQLAINKAHEWAENHGFKFSTTKTIAIQFHRRNGLIYEPALYLNGCPIMFRETAKFLGVTLDQRLKWEPHIKQLKQDCYKRLNLMRCVSHLSYGADRTVALRLYSAIIRSKLDYACIIYSSANDKVLDKLEPVQNHALRLAIGAFKSSPIESLQADSGLPPLAIRREQLLLQYYARAMKCPDSLLYTCIREIHESVPELISVRSHQLMTRYNLELDLTIPVNPPTNPPWLLESPICCGYSCPPKNTTPAVALKQLFEEHCHLLHHGQDRIFTDGSKGSQVACAAVHGSRIRSRKINKNGSIFTAELLAILQALYVIRETRGHSFVVFSDSKSALQAIGNYRNPHPILSRIFEWLAELHARQKRVVLCWVPSHIGVDGNEAADRAARLAAESNGPVSYLRLPHTDHYSTIKLACRSSWEAIWSGTPTSNKLRSIKPTLKIWRSSLQEIRKEEVLLARLRIGHTRLTQAHLMQGRRRDDPDLCEDCIVPLTVLHVLVECPSYIEQRRRYLPAEVRSESNPNEALKIILAEDENNNFNIRSLINYLKSTQIYDKL